jgi:trk system potassium uptake protein
VTVIDIDPAQARRIDESYDVRGMVGHAAHPEVLERAGAARRRHADRRHPFRRGQHGRLAGRLHAVRVKRRIARVRHQGYLDPLSRGSTPPTNCRSTL